MRYKILISPAKNLRKHVFNDHDRLSVPQFLAEAKLVHRSLAKFNHGELIDLMSISAKLASESKQMIKLWNHNFLYRAVEMFDGEVYRGLDIDTLADEFNDELSDRLRILSGLYGILNPNDLVAPYRLEMKTKLPVKKSENLYQFWGERIAKYLKKDTDVLVNLASDEYSKVVLPFWDKDKVITPVFMEENEGNPKVVMMYAKNARGKMARFIIEHRIDNLSDIQGFDLDGYRFDKERSVENRLVFLR